MSGTVALVVGARPQFVKAAVTWRALDRHAALRPLMIHTGQHYDWSMSERFFDELGMPEPDCNLGIGSGSHGEQTGRMLAACEQSFDSLEPDAVVVFGDTNSTIAAALAAVKMHIPLAHVEAGLRSFNRRMPEEINRIATDHIADLLFPPTKWAADQLLREGVDPARIVQSGDVMLDAALAYRSLAQSRSTVLHDTGMAGATFAVVTLHRAENTDDADLLACAVDLLISASRHVPLLWPLHPRVRRRLEEFGLLDRLQGSSVVTCEPVGYLDMLGLLDACCLVITDSGGLQKEAFFYEVPCITLRQETEWVELVDGGWNRLAPIDRYEQADFLALIDATKGSRGEAIRPYGDGRAAEVIADTLADAIDQKEA